MTRARGQTGVADQTGSGRDSAGPGPGEQSTLTLKTERCGEVVAHHFVFASALTTERLRAGPRQAAPVPAGTAALGGVVQTDGTPPQPRRAIVTTGAEMRGSRQFVTDETGRWQFSGLPAAATRSRRKSRHA
jgi:hypothetical protein